MELTNSSWPAMFTNTAALAVELDGKPGREVLYYCTDMCKPPGLAAYHVDSATGLWSELWTQSTGADDAEVVDVADVAFDANADGRLEVVLSFRASASATTWATRVVDGATGAVSGEIAGRFEGAADLDGVPGDEVVVATPSGLVPYGWETGVLVPRSAPLPGVRALTVTDSNLRQRGPLDKRLATAHRPGHPINLYVGTPASAEAYALLSRVAAFADVTAVRLDASGWVNHKTYKPDAGFVTAAFRADFVTRPYEQIALGKSNGTVDILDAALAPTNGAVQFGGQPLGTLIGGNWFPTLGGNIIAVDGSGPFVALPDGPKGLLVGDARLASWIVPPATRWTHSTMGAVSFLDLGTLGTAVVGVEGTHLTARRSSDGVNLGAVDLGPGAPHGTPLPLRDGSTTPLLGIDWRVSGGKIVQRGVSLTTLSEPWKAAPLPILGFFGSTVGDLNNDGVDEWYTMEGPLYRRDIKTGQTTTSSVSSGYALPLVASFSSPGQKELLLQAGAYGPKLVTASLSVMWEGPYPEAFHTMSGTRVECSGAARFVTPAVTSPFVRSYAGSTGALVAERVLAGGSVFKSLASAQTASKKPGMLRNLSSVAGVAGAGPAVVAGSSDGFVYVLDACTLDLLWSEDLGAPVGEASIGDYDDDGADEIVVATSAGYVYGIDHPPLSAPGAVKLNGQPGALELEPQTGFIVSWDAVPDATSYEVGLVTPDEHAIWSPAYQSVVSTSHYIALSEALANRPYRVAVRAVGPLGKSEDVLSDAIVIRDTAAPIATVKGVGEALGKVEVTLDATDDLALDYYVVRWSGGMTTNSGIAADGSLPGKASTTVLALELPPDEWGQPVELVFDVLDSGENVGSAMLDLTVDALGNVSVAGGSYLGPMSTSHAQPAVLADPAPTTNGPPSPPLRPSGGCTMARAPDGGGFHWLATALLGLCLRTRRRTRSALAG